MDSIMLKSTTRADRVSELLEKLEDGVQAVFQSDNYRNYLEVMSRFHRYSFRNTILIWLQCPSATYVAGYNDWLKNFHRYVKKGEKGIRIFAPVMAKRKNADEDDPDRVLVACKVVSVFDLSQTEGEDLPSLGVDELAGNVDGYDRFFNALLAISPVPVEFESIEGGSHGYYHQVDRRIAIQRDMPQLQTVKTAIHEIAHATLHALPADGKRPKDGLNREEREIQAESVAYAVCQHFGLDTSDYSFGYVAGWASGMERKELHDRMAEVTKCTHNIIDQIERSVLS